MPEHTPAKPADSVVTGAGILLDHVTKRYPGQARPAVDGLTMEIPAGKTVMLVGPSGCGKTTTLKMINRLIEPSEGRIVVDGDDVTQMNGDRLRRGIGYVIQAGGLFPHMTVATNIGIVPRMLGWTRERVAARVDELLELVSLDPEQYRDRYPKELSGGQQQRVGVARALAADPPVLLMDEPFGAVDPITRLRLQDELINIQDELQKTIVCVTHDFDEAVKLGDWIAIFDEGAQLVQYDTPERILGNPANEFVENFIGSGAGLKQLTLTRVADVGMEKAVLARPGEPAGDVLARIVAAGHGHAVVVDSRERPIQWLSRRKLDRLETIGSTPDPALPVVGSRATLSDALDTMLVSSAGAALVTGRRDVFKGVIDIKTVMDAIGRSQDAAALDSTDAPVGLNTGIFSTPATGDEGDDSAPADNPGPSGAAGDAPAAP
ncbi:ABC-type proline/glycine betaine transport system ATPase subunit [Cryobacterium sp. MP_M5]|uniref:ATP-binding cassette domain-containing protein n=1 Tax=unclassified Cryobacterium TaxID=2649013 RepID=UPI001A29110D|nr:MULTISPECIES: ATP-binding cassette domain-containing protein [unclassified Cryobacterium]MBG6058717.1 osmoprotectant transport system ATP-binding protein [Cryobacterium sp. MP_M3]MEC5176804.1 ABC-type proline/glycine betaine transport system ATPase subunit [Cryobacterium sp. MP_M5]